MAVQLVNTEIKWNKRHYMRSDKGQYTKGSMGLGNELRKYSKCNGKHLEGFIQNLNDIITKDHLADE